MTKHLLLMIAVVMVSGCATIDTNHFGNVKELGIKYDVPLYYSKPPASYAYHDLGPVTGEDTMPVFDQGVDGSFVALKNMSRNAKAMGANAVIEVKSLPPDWKAAAWQGEAVVFDNLPSSK